MQRVSLLVTDVQDPLVSFAAFPTLACGKSETKNERITIREKCRRNVGFTNTGREHAGYVLFIFLFFCACYLIFVFNLADLNPSGYSNFVLESVGNKRPICVVYLKVLQVKFQNEMVSTYLHAVHKCITDDS